MFVQPTASTNARSVLWRCRERQRRFRNMRVQVNAVGGQIRPTSWKTDFVARCMFEMGGGLDRGRQRQALSYSHNFYNTLPSTHGLEHSSNLTGCRAVLRLNSIGPALAACAPLASCGRPGGVAPSRPWPLAGRAWKRFISLSIIFHGRRFSLYEIRP